jgi:OOP family OmpA-OmpF porin
VTKQPATRLVAAVLIIGGLAIAPLLDDDLVEEPLAGLSPEASVLPAPHFEIIWREGELALQGHTLSSGHERDLLEVAASSYPNTAVASNFEPLGTVPAHWADTTVKVVYLLAETVSADATLSEKNLTIRSVTVDELGWRNRLEAMKKSLPETVSLSTDSLVVDDGIDAATVCARSFKSFETGPVNFEESSAEFRGSAYPRLDRVISLARSCNESRITVTGHTDASGDETWNQRLSLKRANAVADYMAAGGVARSRLKVAGVGSSMPIADDNTRYGRSLNRRIEIALSAD